MRWPSFAICALLVLALQVTAAPRVALLGARPDWLLVLAVFLGLHVRGPEAPIAAWLLGFGADLLSIERLGLLSLCYGLTAALVHRFREVVFRRHPLTHFAVTLAAALGVQLLMLLYRTAFYDWPQLASVGQALHVLVAAVWTGLWAIPAQWLLLRLPRGVAISPPRRG